MINTGVLTGSANTEVKGWVLVTATQTKQSAAHQDYIRWEGYGYGGNLICGTIFGQYKAPPPEIKKGRVYNVLGPLGQTKQGAVDVWANAMIEVTDEKDIEEFKNFCYPSVRPDRLEQIIMRLKTYSESFVSNPNLLKLSQAMFEKMLPFLKTIPAGKSVHDAVRGGLAEHTFNVLSVLDNPFFTNRLMNMNVLLFSALFHDVGKIYSYNGDIQMTEEGMYVPHLVEGIKILTEVIVTNSLEIDAEIRQNIEHCICSHHGPEFSPVKPSTREAVALYHADHMVSNIAHIEGYLKRKEVDEKGWSTNYSHIMGGVKVNIKLDKHVQGSSGASTSCSENMEA